MRGKRRLDRWFWPTQGAAGRNCPTAPGWVRQIVGMKHMVTKASLEVASLAVEAVGGLGVARHSEFERLYRDARMGPIHPANPQLAHELVSKITLGLDLDAQPRWG